VLVKDANGCSASGSVHVDVAKPVAITGTAGTDLCKGSSLQLNVTGTTDIRWIGNTAGMNNPQSHSPIVTPADDITYTAVGYDPFLCYSDTHYVKISVRPLPVVHAGPDLQVFYGSENRLNGTGSADVRTWNWSPPDYLSCVNCPNPVSRPFDDMLYILKGTTAYGCIAVDTIFIKASCAEANVRIPTAFTPNNDGVNDVLLVSGDGVRRVRSFKVFNRWGNVVHERHNFIPGDLSSSWNGRVMGVDAPAAGYVYIAELECSGGEVFTRKGTIVLIR